MSLYEYICPNPNCQKKVERIVKFEDADKQHCDFCDTKLDRQISAPQIKFGESFIKNFRDDVDESGKPYKGFYYDDEYVQRQDEQGVPLV